MITLRASFKLTDDMTPNTVPISQNAGRDKNGTSEHDPSAHGSPSSPVQATPYATVHPPEEAPPGEIRVENQEDDVYTAYTGHVSNESVPLQREYVPMNTRGTHYMDDNTVVREKKANAIDVD